MNLKWPENGLIAHRGASGYAPENTLVAMRRAAELGARWVEFDVMLTQDGVPVVMHDASLKRTTGGDALVVEMDFEAIQTLDAGSWFSDEFAGERIPSLAEMLDCLSQLGLGVNVEIKPAPDNVVETVEAVLGVLALHWSDASLPLLISSSDVNVLEAVHKVDEDLALGWIVDDEPEAWVADCRKISGLVSVNANANILNASNIGQLKAAGYAVLAYTVNDAKKAQQLFDQGVAAVFSDVLN